MAKQRHPILLEAGILILIVGFGLFLNPFHNEPLWAQWLVAPVMIYLALPVSMVAAAAYLFRRQTSSGPPKAATRTRG